MPGALGGALGGGILSHVIFQQYAASSSSPSADTKDGVDRQRTCTNVKRATKRVRPQWPILLEEGLRKPVSAHMMAPRALALLWGPAAQTPSRGRGRAH
jgi:hypothetical protein